MKRKVNQGNSGCGLKDLGLPKCSFYYSFIVSTRLHNVKQRTSMNLSNTIKRHMQRSSGLKLTEMRSCIFNMSLISHEHSVLRDAKQTFFHYLMIL